MGRERKRGRDELERVGDSAARNRLALRHLADSIFVFQLARDGEKRVYFSSSVRSKQAVFDDKKEGDTQADLAFGCHTILKEEVCEDMAMGVCVCGERGREREID